MGPWPVLQVGCGPSGVSLLRQLLPRLARAGAEARVEVCDSAEMGPGLAFSTPYNLHLLNVRAGLMSLSPDDRGEFARWRARRAGVAGGAPAGEASGTGGVGRADRADGGDGSDEADYPPRRLFGDYARTVLAETVRTARDDGQLVELSTERAVALWPAGAGGWRARFSSGRCAVYYTVILALGHLPSRRYSGAEGGPSFLPSPWDDLALPAGHTVGIIGTRLTGIDAALALRERGHAGRIVMASRSGRLPSVKGRVVLPELRLLPRFVRGHRTGTATLRQVAEVIGREIEAAEERPIDWTAALHPPPTTAVELRRDLESADSAWQSVLTAIVPWVPDLWRILDPPGRDLFMSSYLSLWAGRIASFPAITARRLLEMMDSGQLIIRGALAAIEPAGPRHRMRFDDGPHMDADVIINATGPGYGPDSMAANPLTAHLLRTGLATPHRHGGIAVDLRTLEVTGAAGRPGPGLHVIGDLTRGEFLATNAVVNSVRQSVELADVVTRRLTRQRCP